MSEGSGKKERRSSRDFPESFKAGVVAMVLDKGMKPVVVLEQFGLPRATFYRWLKQARIDRGQVSEGELSRDERAELNALRKQVRQLKTESDVIKKWAAFFAKESER
jgi:transposase